MLEQPKVILLIDVPITGSKFARGQQELPDTISILERHFLNTPGVIPVPFADPAERVDSFLERIRLKVAKVISDPKHVGLVEHSYKRARLAKKDCQRTLAVFTYIDSGFLFWSRC